jgi:hypothetical protein
MAHSSSGAQMLTDEELSFCWNRNFKTVTLAFDIEGVLPSVLFHWKLNCYCSVKIEREKNHVKR